MAQGLNTQLINVSRRAFVPLAVATAGVALTTSRKEDPVQPTGKSSVFVAKAASYSTNLASLIEAGIRSSGLNVRGKNVLLKPNLVEYDGSTSINTNAAVIGAAFEVFQRLGAASVVIGEGPGHRRDTYFLAQEADYRRGVPGFERYFVDLNRDDVSPMRPFANRKELYLPNTALAADIIVSLAKMKTHHWAGATLSMKNFFGLVPGAVYGWPKNVLHQIGIPDSIVALNRVFGKTYAIVDGIVGMEGNGPIQGTPKQCGVLVMGSNLPAVDATCCRIMGIDPNQVEYLRMARELGHVEEERIVQHGESIASVRNPFQLIDGFRHLRLG